MSPVSMGDLMASLDAQEKRHAKTLLEAAVKEVRERHQRQVQDFTAQERTTIALQHAREHGSLDEQYKSPNRSHAMYRKELQELKARQEYDLEDLETKIEKTKVMETYSKSRT